jgi:hypothetical protein
MPTTLPSIKLRILFLLIEAPHTNKLYQWGMQRLNDPCKRESLIFMTLESPLNPEFYSIPRIFRLSLCEAIVLRLDRVNNTKPPARFNV